ncbi:MAG: hypothetical protein BJBARM5_1057 [Candidatus Parvarchaeum acidophilus ARMAN-5]|uniref:Transposase IS4 family protein n=1 Tax=Candidatus Parvarchaeum acidophilus ARMAN-5 TaxID=662762 RepID=D6GX33_PARA5|nr:MAG: hypothetical protein BJBARM5_1057 [Candidatus Parvarchaeum acidophilus ARMAN-5]
MHRKEAKRRFDWKSYDKRSLVETVNSVEKRLEGSYVSSRNGWMQKKELRLMDIVYNIHRHMVISGMIFYLLMRISTQPLCFNKMIMSRGNISIIDLLAVPVVS